MADPRKPVERGAPRDQFSISMLHDVHAKLEKLAGMRKMSVSTLIEKICAKEVAAIDDATWDMIDKIAAQLDEEHPLEPGSVEPSKTLAKSKKGK